MTKYFKDRDIYKLKCELVYMPFTSSIVLALTIIGSLAVLAGSILVIALCNSTNLFNLIIGPIIVDVGCDILIYITITFERLKERIATIENKFHFSDYKFDVFLYVALEVASIIFMIVRIVDYLKM